MTASAASTESAASESPGSSGRRRAARCFALLGNPNTGKTTLFNRLCGLRSKTANVPGSTVEARIGSLAGSHDPVIEIVDLPGMYGLNLDRPESHICREYLHGNRTFARIPPPERVVIVADATNLYRNLILVSQALQQGLPAIVALNMIDLARRQGLNIDTNALSARLGCPVVAVSARSGEGIDALVQYLRDEAAAAQALPQPGAPLPETTKAADAAAWADETVALVVREDSSAVGRAGRTTDRIDRIVTHPVLGLIVFFAVMAGLFFAIFTLAAVPMDLIEQLFGWLGDVTDSGFKWLSGVTGWALDGGALHDLTIDGIIGGVAGTVVFLPQICLLFFLISLLEDTGYLARAAFVMDRLLRKFGLPGQAFVPLLSAHACAIPALMSARLIPDHRERLATVLVAPYCSCSARLPVYVLVISLLFGGEPWMAGLAFAGCYLLGGAAALITAKLLRVSLLRGASPPMVLELPTYKMPSIRTALLTTYDRGMMFLKKAGTVILAICIVLWWLSAYPKPSQGSTEAAALMSQAETEMDDGAKEELIAQAELIEKRHATVYSFAGRLGKLAEPVFEPIGYDWQLSVGVLTSFAAREVFVSTMAVLVKGDEEDDAVIERISQAKRDDGSPVFTPPTSASLLVFYVLAMQCLPTLAVTRRETGSWKWAALQLVWMSLTAYVGGWIAFTLVGMIGS